MLVSCLMVTQPGREHLAAQAISDFCGQTWPSPDQRELVIVTDGPAEHREALGLLNRPHRGVANIHIEHGTGSLGKLRNQSIAAAQGEMRIQWDDDDRYAPNRLETQVKPLVDYPGTVATFLTAQLMALPSKVDDCVADIHVVDWSKKNGSVASSWIPGTVAWQRCYEGPTGRYPEAGARSSRGEDDVFLAALTLGREERVLGLDAPLCYLRRFHGSNTWNLPHYRDNANRLSRALLQINIPEDDLRTALRAWYPVSAKLRVVGHGRESSLFVMT